LYQILGLGKVLLFCLFLILKYVYNNPSYMLFSEIPICDKTNLFLLGFCFLGSGHIFIGFTSIYYFNFIGLRFDILF